MEELEELLRREGPRILGALVRRHGDLDACEDAVQEALLEAAERWPRDGVPRNPGGWLRRTAARRLVDGWRREQARRRREVRSARTIGPSEVSLVPGAEEEELLTLLLMCCHPSLTPGSQVALTLRAVAGLTTAEIARGFLVPVSTMAQRISRAKQRIREAGARFELPTGPELETRIGAVLHVLYLAFTEGHTATEGPALSRPDLVTASMRIARRLHGIFPENGEVSGLLSLMLLTDARRTARTRPDGAVIPLLEQDRSQWDRDAIREGIALVSGALAAGTFGPFQVQAAIAAVHAEAERPEDTDWPQVLALYDVLRLVASGPMVTLNRIVALGMVEGPEVALARLEEAAADPPLRGHYRVHAVRGSLLERAGDREGARAEYRLAARRSLNLPEKRYLEARAAR